uniref:Uncharacterized protein n=1 Tax=Arundo donax TaxID=35708 RepID=A0A0A8YU67_ARUDO
MYNLNREIIYIYHSLCPQLSIAACHPTDGLREPRRNVTTQHQDLLFSPNSVKFATNNSKKPK